jgi:hypothetical protein
MMPFWKDPAWYEKHWLQERPASALTRLLHRFARTVAKTDEVAEYSLRPTRD